MTEGDKQRQIEWQQWKQINARNLDHPVGFEERFVDAVLSHINAIDPSDVTAQHGFTDQSGRQRRVDFLIHNDAKGFRLPIELDGKNKDQTHREWNDFLSRQNAIVGIFGVILRFTNLQMINDPSAVIREIAEALAVQSARKTARDQQHSYLTELRDAHMARAQPSAKLPKATVAHPRPSRIAWYKRGVVAAAIIAAAVLLGLYAGGFEADGLSTPNPVATGSPPPFDMASEREAAIRTWDAAAYLGSTRIVCGQVANTREITSGLFVNFDRPYPDQTISAVIWRRNMDAVGMIAERGRGELCIRGRIDTYAGKPIIEISSSSQIVP